MKEKDVVARKTYNGWSLIIYEAGEYYGGYAERHGGWGIVRIKPRMTYSSVHSVNAVLEMAVDELIEDMKS